MSNDNKGLEFQFLESWEGWDEMGVGSLFFYNARPNAYLKELLGEDADLVDGAYLDINSNTFQLYDVDNIVLATFRIKAELIEI